VKDNAALLQDILSAITAIESYTSTISSYSAFTEDEKTQDAIMFNLIIMGEAASKIAREFQDAHPEVPWTSIIGTRNVIVHGYDQVKLQIVWDIIDKNLQPLKKTLNRLV
jgi:uncharacterized protein with HEPN domain